MSGPDADPADPSLDGGKAPPETWAGAPLRSALRFLSVPAVLVAAILGFDLRLPSFVLLGMAAILGAVLLGRVFRDAEWLLAAFVVYIPLSKLFVAPIVRGVNGTNALLVLMVLVWASQASSAGRPLFVRMPGSRLVGWYAALSVFSVATAAFSFGLGDVLGSHGDDLKGWIDAFVIFYAFLHLIRDGAMARRVVFYMMLGGVIVLALGFQEWLDKRWLDSIEKARLLGPQLQPNDFGAFLVYIAGPFLALFLTQLGRLRAWLLIPFFLLLTRMLLATFSRGAFIGIVAAGVAAAWVRGRAFLVVSAVSGALLVLAMPQLVPESLQSRMGATQSSGATAGSEQLDSSSQTRLVLWKAAVQMTLESPILGKGFKAFPRLKGGYTEVDVHESDNHNMFLYVASQMGLPTVLLLIALLLHAWRAGVRVYRGAGDVFGRAAGMGAAAMAAGVVAVNMFGSRLVDVGVSAYFWIYLAALAHLVREVEGAAGPPGADGGSTEGAG